MPKMKGCEMKRILGIFASVAMLVALSAQATTVDYSKWFGKSATQFEDAVSVVSSVGCDMTETNTFTLVYKLSMPGQSMAWTGYPNAPEEFPCSVLDEAESLKLKETGYLYLMISYNSSFDTNAWLCRGYQVNVVKAWLELDNARPFVQNGEPVLIHYPNLGYPYDAVRLKAAKEAASGLAWGGAGAWSGWWSQYGNKGGSLYAPKNSALFALTWATSYAGSINNEDTEDYPLPVSAEFEGNVYTESNSIKNISMQLQSGSTALTTLDKVIGKGCPPKGVYIPKTMSGSLHGYVVYWYAKGLLCPEFINFCVEARLDDAMTKLHNECCSYYEDPNDPGCIDDSIYYSRGGFGLW